MKEFVHEVADLFFSVFVFLLGALLFPNFASFFIAFLLLTLGSYFFKFSAYSTAIFAMGIIYLIIVCMQKPEYEFPRLSFWKRLNKNYKEMHDYLCHKITSLI